MLALLFLLLLGGFAAVWASNRELKRRLDLVEQRLAGDAPTSAPTEPAVPYSVTFAAKAEPPRSSPSLLGEGDHAPEPLAEADGGGAVSPEPPSEHIVEIGAEPHTPPSETLGALFERLVAGRLLIWLGGIALVAAAIYLIRFSIEIGLVTPALRMIAAALFGLALIAAGEAARWKMADDLRIAQALVGAGVAVLYAAAYGSHILYGLIDSGAASAAMLAITAAALGLSLRHGAPTAVMGLVGGFLTPLLVGDPDAGAAPLLAYLALLDLAIFLVAWRRGWTWLAAAAVLLSFLWSGFLLLRDADDALAAGIFIIPLAIAATLARPGQGRSLGLVQPMLLGLVQLAMVAARTDLDMVGWALFGALAAAAMALGHLRPAARAAPPAALALGLMVLMFKAGGWRDPWSPHAALGLTAIFGLGGLAFAWLRGERRWAIVASIGLAGPLLVLRAAWPELASAPQWGGMAALLTLGPAALIWRLRGRASPSAPAELSLLAAGASAAILAGTAAWDLLPAELIVAGWLALGIALALAARRLADLALATIAGLVAAVAVARAVWLTPELSNSFFIALAGAPVLAVDLPGLRTAFFALALPAVLLAGLRLALPDVKLPAIRAVAPVAGALALAALYVAFKQAFGLTSDEDFQARGFLERTILTQALFAAGWLLASGRLRLPRLDPDMVALSGTVLTGFATVRLVWFDLIVHNPALMAQDVGPLPVLNLILPAFWLSAVWLYAASRRDEQGPLTGIWLVPFLIALIAGAGLLVRQAFHGAILTGGEMTNAEFYTYSLGGLVLSIGLLLAGIRLPDKALRLAGLALLTATMLKVFLIDAAALTGILRILSFLGLGIVLIGIGRLYGPILRAEAGGEEPLAGGSRTA
ncbi:DUF2339 domain-containing protein [Sphingosinicella sp.]|uniref:DUF2339 domain-containing protein n=1 Tax=Sphingosinicella sp. TaxID=1917971 RepID=UPI0040382BB8